MFRALMGATLLALAPFSIAQTAAVKPLRIGYICPATGGSADFGNSSGSRSRSAFATPVSR